MASEFIALPLTNGESFLLKTIHQEKEYVILVDSGKLYGGSPHPLLAALKKVSPKLERIDICVCTHQDADHSNGFRTFPDAWCGLGNSIGQFWLPGRWAAALPGILKNPIGTAVKLWRGFEQFVCEADIADEHVLLQETFRSEKIIETVTEAFEDSVIQRDNEKAIHPQVGQSLGLEARELDLIREWLEEDECSDIFALFTATYSPWSSPFAPLLQGAMETANSIRKICEASVRWNIPIRWFDFGLYEKTKKALGGDAGLLEPVCAVELIRPPRRVSPLVLFYSLLLSRQNVESLVFIRPESDSEPACLFLGDSRLAFGIPAPALDFSMPSDVPTRRALITAPHHGSRVNDRAYTVLNNWLKSSLSPIYIRNGGQAGQTLGEYKNQKHRACAQCIDCYTAKWSQKVLLTTKKNDWVLPMCGLKKCLQ